MSDPDPIYVKTIEVYAHTSIEELVELLNKALVDDDACFRQAICDLLRQRHEPEEIRNAIRDSCNAKVAAIHTATTQMLELVESEFDPKKS
jgi:hypothetical protein